jgi:hypothetical protein
LYLSIPTVWEDAAVWNIDFIEIFKCSSPHDLALMERRLLAILAFNVSVRSSEYVSVYFDVREKSGNVVASHGTLKPLDRDAITKIESTSTYASKHNIKAIIRRTGSMDDLISPSRSAFPHSRIVLS